MCGIAGIVLRSPEDDDLHQPLVRMQQALRHRGPDDEGIYLSDGTGQGPEARGQRAEGRRQTAEGSDQGACCGLVHTRLSILDLSAAGHQPMGIGERAAKSDGERRYWITFNGEIYNFRALRKELEGEGVRFLSNTDTEVILRLYEKLGPSCLEKLQGMFALAIWDDLEKTCFLARDPFGVKPLYYFVDGNQLCFASELRALLVSQRVRPQLDPQGVYGYLLFGSSPEPGSVVKGVLRLPAGYYAVWHDGQFSLKNYWSITFSRQVDDSREAAALTRQALLDSVRRHFVSDVPVGIFLSGGLDSTALVALAQQVEGVNVRTYSIAFEEARFDEGAVARRTASYFGTQHSEWRLNSKAGRSFLGDFLESADHPSIDGFNTFCISRLARQNGVKVVLSGLGGDEMFGGYQSFRLIPRLTRQDAIGRVGRRLLRTTAALWQRHAHGPRYVRLADFLQSTPTVERAYWCVRGIFTPREVELLMREFLPGLKPETAWAFDDQALPPHSDIGDTVSYLELTRYMRNQLLRDSDIMSMAWGLELRVPYVDRSLFTAVSTISSEFRLAPRKGLLRAAVPEMPEWVTRGRKMGFLFPFEQWVAEEWRTVFDSIGQRSPVPLRSWYRAWALLALESYLKRLNLM